MQCAQISMIWSTTGMCHHDFPCRCCRHLLIHGPVSDEGIATLLSHSPCLQSIVFDDCRDLTALDITSEHLQSIVMPRARALTALRLDCPNLAEVDITACTHLRELLFRQTSAIRTLKMEFCADMLFASLPSDLLSRVIPRRGVRTERGGSEESVARSPGRRRGQLTSTAPAASSGAECCATGFTARVCD
jgi:hypothetical protein